MKRKRVCGGIYHMHNDTCIFTTFCNHPKAITAERSIMNKIGVQSTGSIIQGDIEAGYRRIKEAGFDCVDFNFDEYLHCTMVERGEINAVLDRPCLLYTSPSPRDS